MIPNEVVCEDYEVVKKIGEGSFGYVYKVRHRTTHEMYAMKTDQKSVTKMEHYNEISVLKEIQQKIKQRLSSSTSQKVDPIVKCLGHDFSQITSNKMFMPLLGENIFNLFQKCNKRFDSHTVYQVSKAMLKSIEFIHDLGFIHRDIKPQNFVIGQLFDQDEKGRTDDEVYLVDFGLAKEYVSYDGKQHVPYKIGRKIRGTPMYMSINVMHGIQPSRRDDLQSLMYIIVFLLKGRMPWHNLKITRKDFDQLIMAKVAITPEELFSNLPKQLKETFIYIRRLKFEQKPSYVRIMQSLESILTYKNPKIEEQYSGKYRQYCWEVMYDKESFQEVNLALGSYVKNNWLQALSKQSEYSLLK